MSTFAPLADRDFRLYFAGEVLSMSGSGLHIVALGWYLLARTGSATSVGLVWALGLGAGIFMLPFAGPLADRYPRRLITIGSDLYRLVLVAVMASLAFAGSPSLPALYALTFLVGLGHSVFWPAVTALLQEVIRPDQLTEASGLVEITWQAGNLTGAALGGPILVRFGLGTAFAIDAASYALSAAALLALHHRPAPAERPHESGLRMARAGLAYLRRRPAVAGFGVASVVPWIATISLNVVLVAYVLRELHLGATAYGLADMTYGVGAMASGVFAALLVLRLGEWRAMTAVMAALVACYGVLAGGPAAVGAFYVLLFAAGFCSSAFRVMASAGRVRAPGRDRGRGHGAARGRGGDASAGGGMTTRPNPGEFSGRRPWRTRSRSPSTTCSPARTSRARRRAAAPMPTSACGSAALTGSSAGAA